LGTSFFFCDGKPDLLIERNDSSFIRLKSYK
jgi:hypothetical protein